MSGPGAGSGWGGAALAVRPIATVSCSVRDKALAPRQARPRDERSRLGGEVRLSDPVRDLACVRDLHGFSHIWLISWLDRALGWRALVRPPRGRRRVGLLATRAPHRPNPIGLSCVRLLGVAPDHLLIGPHDLLDGTPILDIKPYLPYCDSVPAARAGWLDELPPEVHYRIRWTPEARARADWLRTRGVDLELAAEVLRTRPHPSRGHRLEELARSTDGARCRFAHRTWRLEYSRDDRSRSVVIEAILSAGGLPYGVGAARPEDDPTLHREFAARFPGAQHPATEVGPTTRPASPHSGSGARP